MPPMNARETLFLHTDDVIRRRIRIAVILLRPDDAVEDPLPCIAGGRRMAFAAESLKLVYSVVALRCIFTDADPLRRSIHVLRGYMQRSGSISPVHRQRVKDGYYEPDFSHPRGPRSGRGMRGRGGGRFRAVLPPAFGRGGKSYTRGFNSSAHAISPFEGEFIHRNDPNLSPREGDWICRNPLCGNLNFARRTYCNNCDKYRYVEPDGSSHSPRRAYVSPPLRSLSPKLPVSPIDRGPRRDFNGYRSPPRGWDPDDVREFNTSSIPPRRGGKFLEPLTRDRMDFREDNFKGRGKSDWPVGGDWERRGRDTFDFDSRVKRRPLSPQDRWIRDTRDRSRSPIGGRLPSGSFVGRGRGRGDRRYDGLYVGNGRADDLDGAHGRGYRHGVARGRSPDVY